MADNPQAWRKCAQWLCALEVLPSNHRVMMPDANCQDMAYTLRDGVLLCHVALALDEASIDAKAVNHRPQMAQFLCLKNIRLFLAAAKSSFGLRDSDLFEPSMLYDFSDFARVLQTLSILSKCTSAMRVKSWSLDNSDEDSSTTLYQDLECDADDGTYQEFYYKHQGNYGYVWGPNSENRNAVGNSASAAIAEAGNRRNYAYMPYYYVDEEKEEEIYADLGLVRRPHHHRSQSAAARLQDWKFEPKETKDFCLVELLETEANYVDVLNRLRKNFIRPITTIKESEKKVIFMNTKELGDIHTAFFTALFNCVREKPYASKRIGDVFIEFKEKFLKYADYCCGLPRAQITLDTLCAENKEVEKEIRV